MYYYSCYSDLKVILWSCFFLKTMYWLKWLTNYFLWNDDWNYITQITLFISVWLKCIKIFTTTTFLLLIAFALVMQAITQWGRIFPEVTVIALCYFIISFLKYFCFILKKACKSSFVWKVKSHDIRKYSTQLCLSTLVSK